MTNIDEFIFSPTERTVVRFSYADAYRIAGNVIRHKRRLPDDARLHLGGTTDRKKRLTMVGLSQAVNDIVEDYMDSHWQ